MKIKISAAIMATMLLFTSTACFAAAGTVTASSLNVRTAPWSTVVGRLEYGTPVEVLGSENGWYQIRFGEGIGYVFSDYVLHTEEAPAEETEAVISEEVAPSAGENILAYAKNFIGVPYRYGGSSPSGFDCSGFVKFVYSYFGVNLPRTSYSQMQSGYAVSLDSLMPGDLLFFRGGGHVGIYAGNNTYIHAPQTGRTVSIDPLDRTVIAARRIF